MVPQRRVVVLANIGRGCKARISLPRAASVVRARRDGCWLTVGVVLLLARRWKQPAVRCTFALRTDRRHRAGDGEICGARTR